MKTQIKKQLGLMMAIALVLGCSAASAQAADTDSLKGERPARANTAEIKSIIKNFQDQKKQFLDQQKEQQGDTKTKVREEFGSSGGLGNAIRDAKDAIAEAKRVSREQARKLADEAKQAAKDGRKRD